MNNNIRSWIQTNWYKLYKNIDKYIKTIIVYLNKSL